MGRGRGAMGGISRRRGLLAGPLILGALAGTSAAASSSPSRALADIIVTVPGCVVDPSDVIGWWKGDGDLTARIGPELLGDVSFVPGIIGQGMSFDGASALLAGGLAPVSDGVTVSVWMKPASVGFVGHMQTLAARWDFPSADDSARSYALLLDPFQNLVWTTDETSTRRPEELVVAAPQLFDGNFHHIAATWNSTTTALYIDGLPAGSRASQGGVLNPATDTLFSLGSKSGIGDPFHFNGTLDEPAVIKRALTAAEVAALVGAGPKGLCLRIDSTGVVGPGLQVPGDVGGVDPVISADGRYILFRTRSTNVFPVVNEASAQTPGVDFDMFDNYRDDLVLLDTKATFMTADDTMELVSVSSDELGGGLDSTSGKLTPNASHVVFASISNDLVAGDTLAGRDVFIRDRATGTTERVSVRSDGTQPEYTATGLNNDSNTPSVNDAGTVIAFASTNRGLAPETNPEPGDTWQTYDIYVRDISDPVSANRTTTRITVGLGDVKANGSSSTPIVSADGRYVWFSSAASNLTPGDTNNQVDLFVHDRQTATTTRLEVTGATGLALDGAATLADVSPNGRWVTFTSNATTIVPGDTNGTYDVFLLDTQTSTVVRASSSADVPQANGSSFAGPVSDDGRYVTFESSATNLVVGDSNGRQDVFVKDIVDDRIWRVSLLPDGTERNGTSASPSATANGATVVYRVQIVGESVFSIWRADLHLHVP